MIKKTKEALRNLKFGLLELILGALMIIGLVGYFGNVGADLDWIDHTVSFILFTYLFYQMNITSILFGKTSKLSNAVIVISYFSLFFKDIIIYSFIDKMHFSYLTFIASLYNYFLSNPFITEFTIYFGSFGIIMVSLYLTIKIKVSAPSLLSVFQPYKFKNKLVKFISIFVLLLGFYFFVYNNILEFLEFVLDDPIVAVGIIYYVYHLSKHHANFNKNNFVFKIGDYSTKLYRKFVSLFHYKKTLPLGISGLLVMYALSDLGVFAYSLAFLQNNFYLNFLEHEHIPFLSLFLGDMGLVAANAAIHLLILYILQAISLITFLLIPVLVWGSMFFNREFHFNRLFLFFIYSSIVCYILLPGYIISPLESVAITGVDIVSVSLLDAQSALGSLFSTKSAEIIAVSIISVTAGLIAYLLSFNKKIKKELYALSIISGLAFYTVYLYYYFGSILMYFGASLSLTTTRYLLLSIMLCIFLVLSAFFFIGGYILFLYEIIMEYHKKKWSEPIDEELYSAIGKINRYLKQKKEKRD